VDLSTRKVNVVRQKSNISAARQERNAIEKASRQTSDGAVHGADRAVGKAHGRRQKVNLIGLATMEQVHLRQEGR
jgi:hypothetical protein